MEGRRVVVTGVGVIAPNGIGIDSFWDSLIHGRSGVRKITHFDASSYSSKMAGEVHDFDPLNYMDSKSARRMDRFAQFAAACTKMALDDANLGSLIEIQKEQGLPWAQLWVVYHLRKSNIAYLLKRG